MKLSHLKQIISEEVQKQKRLTEYKRQILNEDRVLCACPPGSTFEGDPNEGLCECKCAVGLTVCFYEEDRLSAEPDVRRTMEGCK